MSFVNSVERRIHQYDIHDDKGRRSKCLGIRSEKYLSYIVKELETRMQTERQTSLSNTTVAPIRSTYRPEVDY